MRIYISFILLLTASISFAQSSNINVSKITVKDSLWLAGRWISKISNDTALGNGDNTLLTQSAIKGTLSNYYSKGQLKLSGQSEIHWDNITNKPDSRYILNQPSPIQTGNFNISGVGTASGFKATNAYALSNFSFRLVNDGIVDFYYGPGSRSILQMGSSGGAGFGTAPTAYAVTINCEYNPAGLNLAGMVGTSLFRGDSKDSILVINPASNTVKYASLNRMLESSIKTGVVDFPAGTTSITVNTTVVTANSRLFLTVQEISCTDCTITPLVATRSAGTSFTIACLKDATTTAKVAWMAIEP